MDEIIKETLNKAISLVEELGFICEECENNTEQGVCPNCIMMASNQFKKKRATK